eukprot:NODE_176_length_15869_cov_0.275777.p3 type:complete len:425 gc:universal NODE_176_length_15869_cov_0.275777:143-1417(+)
MILRVVYFLSSSLSRQRFKGLLEIAMLHPSDLCVVTGDSEHECGYCKEISTSIGMWSYKLSASSYLSLIDFGWRRSGQYVYHPNKDTCCPQYAIRMDLYSFYPSKQIRRALNHFNFSSLFKIDKPLSRKNGKVVRSPNTGIDNLRLKTEVNTNFYIPQPCLNSQANSNKKLVFNLEYELFRIPFLKIVLAPSEFDQDTFLLYQNYQIRVHHDDPDEVTADKYTRFLVNHPFPFNEPFTALIDNVRFSNKGYGFYHLKIYVLDELKAVSFVDILPSCISSVYSIYSDDSYEWGKITACYEIYIGRQLSLSLPKLKYFYLGFYIDNCTKMKYKSIFKPCYLLDPIQYVFVPFNEAICLLRKSRKYTKLVLKKLHEPIFMDLKSARILIRNSVYTLSQLDRNTKVYQDIEMTVQRLPNINLLFLVNT